MMKALGTLLAKHIPARQLVAALPQAVIPNENVPRPYEEQRLSYEAVAQGGGTKVALMPTIPVASGDSFLMPSVPVASTDSFLMPSIPIASTETFNS